MLLYRFLTMVLVEYRSFGTMCTWFSDFVAFVLKVVFSMRVMPMSGLLL
jgi:hypothetical protein